VRFIAQFHKSRRLVTRARCFSDRAAPKAHPIGIRAIILGCLILTMTSIVPACTESKDRQQPVSPPHQPVQGPNLLTGKGRLTNNPVPAPWRVTGRDENNIRIFADPKALGLTRDDPPWYEPQGIDVNIVTVFDNPGMLDFPASIENIDRNVIPLEPVITAPSPVIAGGKYHWRFVRVWNGHRLYMDRDRKTVCSSPGEWGDPELLISEYVLTCQMVIGKYDTLIWISTWSPHFDDLLKIMDAVWELKESQLEVQKPSLGD
jgi:hypothetical protein